MAKHKVVHSDDHCTIVIEGNKANPEPSGAAIKFPGGVVEVSRTSDGSYWAHISVDKPPFESRIDYNSPELNRKNGIPDVPDHENIEHIAVRIANRRKKNNG